jgi:hypothetical protein
MKLAKIFLPVVLMFCLAGCFDIDEEIDVNKNGSGQWQMHVDMSQLLDIMQTYMSKDDLEKQFPENKMDTMLLMKNLIDTATNITADKKALIRDGRVHLQLNMDEKLFKTDMHFPFKNLDDLQKLRAALGNNSLGTGQLLKGLSGGDKNDSSDNAQDPDLSMFSSLYDFKINNSSISNKLNKEKWEELQKNPQFSQMKDAGGSGMEVPYSLTIKLPREVKKSDNPLIKLSDDKKTVTIKYNMIEMFQQPEKFEYTIDY